MTYGNETKREYSVITSTTDKPEDLELVKGKNLQQAVDERILSEYGKIEDISKEQSYNLNYNMNRIIHEEREWRVEQKKKENIKYLNNSIRTKIDKIEPGIFQQIIELIEDKELPIAVEISSTYVQSHYNIHTLRTPTGKKPETWITIDGIESESGESYVFEIVRVLFGEYYKKHIAQQVLDKINVDTLITQEEYFKESDPRWIPMENGVYDIVENKLVNYPKNVRFFARIPVKYEPTAKCPAFLKHLDDVLIDKKDKEQIQETFGFSLYRSYCFEKSFMWLGDGRNGKGKTGDVLGAMIGMKNITSVDMNSIANYTFALIGLHRKYVNLVGEMEQKEISATNLFKAVTGGDTVTAPRKHLTEIEFKSYATWINMANEVPVIKDRTFAFFNRVNLISFPFTFIPQTEYDLLDEKEIKKRNFKVADPNHIKRLTTKEEIQGVFNFSIEGLQRLLKNKGFTTSKTTKDVMHIMLRKSNNFLAFKEELMSNDWGSFISKKKLRYLYLIYCRMNSVVPVDDKKIFIVLKDEMGISGAQRNNASTRHNNISIWDGLKIDEVEMEKIFRWGESNGMPRPDEEFIDIPDTNSIYIRGN